MKSNGKLCPLGKLGRQGACRPGEDKVAARRRDRDVAAVSKLHSLRRPLGREVPPGAHRGPQARPPEGREGNGSMTAGREGQECRTYSSP